MVQVRATDGIHFTTYGYDLVMDPIYPADLGQSQAAGTRSRDRVPQRKSDRGDGLPKSGPLLLWALILAIGAAAAGLVARLEPGRAVEVVAPQRALTVAELFAKAQVEAAPRGAERQRNLNEAARLTLPAAYAPPPAAVAEGAEQRWLPRLVDGDAGQTFTTATIQPPDGAAGLLRMAMTRAPRVVLEGPHAPPAPRGTALAALDALAPSGARLSDGVSTPTANSSRTYSPCIA